MCGIAGHDTQAGPPSSGARLADALDRRGPDGSACGTYGRWALTHTRLAVIDLSADVRYPMTNETESLWLAFNGEIYNFLDLRAQLIAAGHTFRTRCDAEVIVHGWEEWGPALLPRLAGMFAFALVDERRDELVLARDRFGIKPLCVTANGPVAFASDAMALVDADLVAAKVDEVAVDEYLAFHYVPPPRTGISGVYAPRARNGHGGRRLGCAPDQPLGTLAGGGRPSR